MIASEIPICMFLLSFFIIKVEAFTAKSLLEDIPFEQWSENPSTYQVSKLLSSPSPYVIVTNIGFDGCNTIVSCQILLNEVLTFEKDAQNVTKLSNFYISGNGDIFSGHGWHSHATNFINCGGQSFIEITFIGNVDFSTLTTTQIRVTQRLLEYGLINEHLSDSYVLFGAWQLKGKNYPWTPMNKNLVKMWPHWFSGSDNQCKFVN